VLWVEVRVAIFISTGKIRLYFSQGFRGRMVTSHGLSLSENSVCNRSVFPSITASADDVFNLRHKRSELQLCSFNRSGADKDPKKEKIY